VHWYTESTRPEAVLARSQLNEWYCGFDDPDDKFAARLRSEVDADHLQAIDELYVHQLLRLRWEDVRYEEGGVGTDFRIYEAGRPFVAVEVLSLFQRQDWSDQQVTHWRIADSINARLSPTHGYFVRMKVQQADRDPSPKRLTKFLREGLSGLPSYEELAGRVSSRADLPSAHYAEDGVSIEVSFVPMRAGAAADLDDDTRIIGIGAITGGMVNSGERLKDRIAAKAGGRYDIAVPFLIAVGIHDSFCSAEQVMDALYGKGAVEVATSSWTRRHDGLFGVDRVRANGRHTRVSAIAAIKGLYIGRDESPNLAVYDNPLALMPWPTDALPFARRFGIRESAPEGFTMDWLE
jgi:hypothetical protein